MKTSIRQFSIDGDFIAEYSSIKSAALKTGMSAKSISRCCSGKRKSYNGYIWVRVCDAEQLDSRLSYFVSTVSPIEGEVWRDIKDYDGLYQVSSMGRVKTLERIVNTQFGYRHHKEQIISFYFDKDGYCRVTLCKNGKDTHALIHRLVCNAFVGNPNNLPEVNHINGVKDDNRIENLEWCTRSENEQHAYDTGLAKGQKGHLRPMAKPIRLIHSITNEVLRFGCIADCARFFKGKQKNLEAAIRSRANGKIKKYLNGYIVEFIK